MDNPFTKIAREAAAKTDRELGLSKENPFDLSSMSKEQLEAVKAVGVLIIQDLFGEVEAWAQQLDKVKTPTREQNVLLDVRTKTMHGAIDTVRQHCQLR